ncbi:MAG: hypothetical protein QM589_10315 [Thermomicrobiales bacterium]
MSKRCPYALVAVLIAAILLGSTYPVTNSSAASPPGTPDGTPEPGLGCTQWVDRSLPPDTTPTSCTLSDPWWTAWSTCDITPVHSTPSSLPGAPDFLPWILIDMGPVQANAVLFIGNRPLPVGQKYPNDDMNTKVLWVFDDVIAEFSGVATNLDNPDTYTNVPFLETGPTYTGMNEQSTEWPSYVSVPAAGCWRFDLKATTAKGEVVTGSFTYVAVP